MVQLMRRHQLSGSRAYSFWLFTLLLLATLKTAAQIEPLTKPTPAIQPGQSPSESPQTAGEATEPVAKTYAAENKASASSRQPPVIGKLQPITVQARSLETLPAKPVHKTKPKPQSKDADQALQILGTRVARGASERLLWVSGETTYGSKLEAPVYVIHGKHPGPTLCLTAAIHGDELNGVEIIRKLVSDLSPKTLYGTVIGVPIVNLLGFTRGTRYLPDRRDLNRYFPGNPNGSSASRIAFSFFENIVRHCDLLIDLHTGSLTRTNMPQVRANLQIPEVLELTTKFGSTAVLHSRKLRGNLRSAATNYGIPAVALELGEPGSLQQVHVEEGIEIIETVMSGLNMTRRLWTVGGAQPVFYSSRWVRVNTGGLLISEVEVGERIWAGAVLGSMVNPITNESFEVISPYSGRVLGMALNQFMLPGYAAFNIGIVADEKEVVDDAQSFECISNDMDPDQVSEEFGCAPGDDEELESVDIDLGITEDEEGS
jgi:predicted deacylase